jgi:hypothetical protein|tara:strand:+ start:114 stop:482 length:369 start_codon:yes stop_codon:yes gene_type:complete
MVAIGTSASSPQSSSRQPVSHVQVEVFVSHSPFSMQSRFEVQLNGTGGLDATPVVIFIGHLLGSSGGTELFKQQQFSPLTQPIYETFKDHGSLKENETHRDEAQHAARHVASVLGDGSGVHW